MEPNGIEYHGGVAGVLAKRRSWRGELREPSNLWRFYSGSMGSRSSPLQRTGILTTRPTANRSSSLWRHAAVEAIRAGAGIVVRHASSSIGRGCGDAGERRPYRRERVTELDGVAPVGCRVELHGRTGA